MPHTLITALALLLCLAPCARGQEGGADALDAARRLASSADDHAAAKGARQEAVWGLEEAARLSLVAGERAEAARALNRAGRLRLLLNEPQAALDAHRRALALLKGAPAAGEEEVDGLNGLGETYLFLQQKGRAEKALRRSLALSERTGQTRGRARALVTLSDLQNYDDHSLALETAQEALELWQSLGDARGLARAHTQVGRCHMARNALAEATLNYERALQLWRELGDAAGQAGALIMLGYIELRKGEWEGCISLLTQAQALVDEEAEPERMGQIATGLGAAFNETGSPEKGLTHFQRALELYRQTGNPHSVRYAVWEVGCTYFLLGNYAEALTRFREVLATADEGGLDAASAHEYVGRIHLETGREAAALPYLRAALAVYERAGNRREAAQVRALLGKVFERGGQLERARESYRRSLSTFEALSDRVNLAAVHYALGRLELWEGDYGAAEGHLRRSVEVTDDVRRVSASRDLMAAFSAAVHERYEAYVECLMRMHAADPSRGFDARAFEGSESSRARTLAELLRATETSLVPGLDPQLARRERALRQSLRFKEDERVALLGGRYEKRALEALDAELARLGAEYGRVEEEVRALRPSYAQLERGSVWDLRRIQERVVADDQTVLLEYSLGAERSYVWAVTRDRVESYELPARALIEEAAERVYARLSTRAAAVDEDGLANASRELSRMLLSPVAALEGRARVIVVADGALNYVPFQLLPEPAGEGRPLVAGREVVNAPSASVLGQLREEAGRRAPASETLAAFGDPVFASNYALRREAGAGGVEVAAVRRMEEEGWRNSLRGIEVGGDSFDPALIRPLYFAGLELANLRELAPGGEAFVADSFDATRERLQGTDLGRFAILHFATHGLLDPLRPEKSGLMLSTVDRAGGERAGFVGLRDIYGLHAPVELVVLSACRTALGKEVRGEGLIGLTRGFMYAGASSVVSSLWKVDDEATSELMKRFYSNMLREGMTPAAALGAAQNSIRQEPRWRSPHYWAAFTLQGEYSRVIGPAAAPAASPFTKGVAASALAALAAFGLCGAWWFRRRRRVAGV